MKTLIVREAFTLGANDYPRGSEITDTGVISMVLESHASHVMASQNEVSPPEGAPVVIPVTIQDTQTGTDKRPFK